VTVVDGDRSTNATGVTRRARTATEVVRTATEAIAGRTSDVIGSPDCAGSIRDTWLATRLDRISNPGIVGSL